MAIDRYVKMIVKDAVRPVMRGPVMEMLGGRSKKGLKQRNGNHEMYGGAHDFLDSTVYISTPNCSPNWISLNPRRESLVTVDHGWIANTSTAASCLPRRGTAT